MVKGDAIVDGNGRSGDINDVVSRQLSQMFEKMHSRFNEIHRLSWTVQYLSSGMKKGSELF